MFIFLMLMLFPVAVFAECAEWWDCPYRSPSDEPNYRYVSLADLDLEFEWKEIEIEGNRALVCLSEPMPAGDSADCARLDRGQVRGARLRPPLRAYFDTTEGVIKFTTERRRFSAELLKRHINDSAISDTILDDRNEGR